MIMKIPTSFLFAFLCWVGTLYSAPLKICATVPGLGDLASIIGGQNVEVTTFVKGQEDPHSLVAKPSDVLALSRADAFILLGMSMETGWAPALIDRSRNSDIRQGTRGYIDASSVIKPIHDAPGDLITRAMGDLHPEGNPHYMLDPVNGLKVARLLSASFSEIRPSLKDTFAKNLAAFEKKWGEKAFGQTLVARYGLNPLVGLVEKRKLSLFLSKTKEGKDLKGWFGDMAEIQGAHLVSDHEQWVYFSNVFNLKIERALESKPGVPAGNKYLKHLVEWMKAHNVKGVLASPYFNPRHLSFVEKHSGAKILRMAHQAGSRSGTHSYLAMIDHNVQQVCLCCKVN
jgi:ABC-type Zn uptake system ZnuABC Zn-binding protein ZnuA